MHSFQKCSRCCSLHACRMVPHLPQLKAQLPWPGIQHLRHSLPPWLLWTQGLELQLLLLCKDIYICWPRNPEHLLQALYIQDLPTHLSTVPSL